MLTSDSHSTTQHPVQYLQLSAGSGDRILLLQDRKELKIQRERAEAYVVPALISCQDVFKFP